MRLVLDTKQRVLRLLFCAIVIILAVGIAATKLTVHDTVPTGSDYSCVNSILQKPMDKLSLEYLLRVTGQTQVVHADSTSGDVKFYTIFRIPLALSMSVQCLPAPSGTTVSLVNGKAYSLGTFHDSAIVDGAKLYASSRFGISFKYPIGFSVFEGGPDTSGVSPYDGGIDIAAEPYTSQALIGLFQGEFPAGMMFAFYRNTEHLSLENWIHKTNPAYSNYIPSDPTSNLTSTTFAGVPAFKYHSNLGLFATDYITFIYKDWIVLFVVNDMGSDTTKNMQTVLSSASL